MDINGISTPIYVTNTPSPPLVTTYPTTPYNVTYSSQPNHDRYSFSIAIIFLIVAITMGLVAAFYFIYWRPFPSAPFCQNNDDCGIGQSCQFNSCVEISCSSNSDCGSNELCINSYCYGYNCQTGNDCPTGTACIGPSGFVGVCATVGSTCTSNANCFDLTCMNQVCVQCLSNTDCPTGQGCFDQACRYPYEGETGPNMINYSSPAQTNGNISAPPGYFCLATICGTGTNSPTPISCGTTGTTGTTCPTTCPYCVNNNCRCTQGQIYENCNTNSDCASGICASTEIGTVCIPSGGECAFNYNGTGCSGCCTISKPYCVNGICSNTSLGAFCGSTGLPSNMCSNPLSLGAVGTTATSPDGMGFFCINGICQETSGTINELCSGNSCTFIENNILTCTSVSTPSITQMRCLPP